MKITTVCSIECYRELYGKIKCVVGSIDRGQREKTCFEEILATSIFIDTHA